MRILSQNGVDIPYDLYGFRQLSSDLSKIIAFQNSDEYLVVAKYSNAEKAEKAMEMLREAYCGIVKVSKEITDMEVKQIAEDIRNGFVQPMPIQEPEIECKYFQFPADEELEV